LQYYTACLNTETLFLQEDALGSRTSLLLCQPDAQHGCSACCGLFNLRNITRENLSAFLAQGRARVENIDAENRDMIHLPRATVRDAGSHVCPYQGFIDEKSLKPGCLLHPLHCGQDLRGRSLFGSKICGDYLCPAHYIFSDEQVRVLLRCIDDWYLYTVAVLDPESFVWMTDTLLGCTGVKDLEQDNPPARLMLTKALMIHAEYLGRIETPVFHYALSEYRLHKHSFSLGSPSKDRDAARERIIDECAPLCL
jgi:hypothetical protein